MSASTEKKNRQAARQAGTDKKLLAAQEAEKKALATKRKWTAGAIAVALCIALVLFLSSPLMYRITTAETIGSKNYSPADVKYVITNTKSNINYNLYANYLGQEAADEALASSLKTSMIQTAALLQYAQDNGISLTEGEKTAIAEAVSMQLDQMGEAAKENKVSLSRYMGYVYGNGVNRSVIEKGLSESILANKAYFSKFLELSFSQEELDAYNAGLEANGDLFSYATYSIAVGEDRSAEDAQAAAAAVKEGYEESMKEADDALTALNEVLAEEFGDAQATPAAGNRADALDTLFHDWMLEDGRQAGDLEVFADEDGSWTVVLFQERSDNTEPVAQVRHILIKAEADEDGNYTDEAKAAAKTRAEELLAEWEAGDKNELAFASLAFLYSEDGGSRGNGGLYTDVHQGQMVEEFDRFCFEEHEYGDTAIVYGESGSYAGYHVMFYVGSDIARNASARDALCNEALEGWFAEITEGLEPVYRWAYKLVD